MTAQPFTFETLRGETRVGGRSSAASRAEEIVANAHAEAANVLAAARDQGYADGHAAGLDAVMAELEPVHTALESVLRELSARQDDLCAQAERAGVELALRLADKVLSTALDVNPELVLDVVTGALRRVADRGSVVLEVNPDDYDTVRTAIDEIVSGLGGFSTLDIVPERRVGRGGCTVRLAEGEIGSCIDEQLARAGEIVRDALR